LGLEFFSFSNCAYCGEKGVQEQQGLWAWTLFLAENKVATSLVRKHSLGFEYGFTFTEGVSGKQMQDGLSLDLLPKQPFVLFP
jgi:hypothetical protein